jgi:hypothetical protein
MEIEETTQVDNSGEVIQLHSDEVPEVGPEEFNESTIATLWSNHGTKVLLKVKKGKLKGDEMLHFKCSYCKDKHFQGPSSTAFLEHLRKIHPQKCPELLPNVKKQPIDFFSKAEKMVPFNEDVFKDEKTNGEDLC